MTIRLGWNSTKVTGLARDIAGDSVGCRLAIIISKCNVHHGTNCPIQSTQSTSIVLVEPNDAIFEGECAQWAVHTRFGTVTMQAQWFKRDRERVIV